MTYEEALNQFNSTNPFMHGSDKQEEYFNVIRKALEKQIPKKPYLDNDNGIYEKMTEREALTEIKGLIDKYWGTDPIYYTDSLNPHEAGAAKLCCKIKEIINNVTETTQSEPKIEEKPKKKVYAISYEQFVFGKHYDRYIQFVETEDIFHEVGVLIYKASTAVRNIRWCELRDESVEAAIARYMSEYSEDWKRINGTDVLRFTERIYTL